LEESIIQIEIKNTQKIQLNDRKYQIWLKILEITSSQLGFLFIRWEKRIGVLVVVFCLQIILNGILIFI